MCNSVSCMFNSFQSKIIPCLIFLIWVKIYPPTQIYFEVILILYPEYKICQPNYFSRMRKWSTISLAFEMEKSLFPFNFWYPLLTGDKVWAPVCLQDWFTHQTILLHSSPVLCFLPYYVVVTEYLVKLIGKYENLWLKFLSVPTSVPLLLDTSIMLFFRKMMMNWSVLDYYHLLSTRWKRPFYICL